MNITPFLYVPFVAWAVAQIIKFGLAVVRGEGNIRYLYASGGMPSVHSAVVCSLATWAFIDGGLSSPLFGFAAVFAGIVMYDSFGVRRSTGEQARTLNQLITDLVVNGDLKNADDYNELREILGHKPLEVVVGAGLGVFIAAAFGYSKLVVQFPMVFSSPSTGWVKALMIFGGLLLMAAPVKYIWGVKRYKKSKVAQTKLSYIVLCNALFGLLIAICAFLAYENINAFFAQWIVIVIISIAWLIITLVFIYQFRSATKSIRASEDTMRKDAWLRRAKRKKK